MKAEEICRELDRRKSGGAPFGRLLCSAVELLHDAHERFDWTGIYELHPDNVLRLGPYLGAATDQVMVSVGSGVGGTAVAERRNINVPDVIPAGYPRPAASARSELAILIRRGDRIYAEIDIDSHRPRAFCTETVKDVERVADWLARAYEQRELVRR